MVHGGGLDPHWFDYPTLLLYVLAPFQAWQDEPSYLTARLIVAAIGVGGVAAAWWLGRAAYGAHRRLRRGCRRRGRDDRRRLLAHGGDRRPMTALDHRLARARRHAAPRVGGRRRRSGREREVSRRLPRRAARRRRRGGSGGASRSRSASPRSPSWRPARSCSSTRTRPGRTRSRVQRLARDGWLGFEHDSWALFSFTGKLWCGARPGARDLRRRPRPRPATTQREPT